MVSIEDVQTRRDPEDVQYPNSQDLADVQARKLHRGLEDVQVPKGLKDVQAQNPKAWNRNNS
jgi:hypothetical protein